LNFRQNVFTSVMKRFRDRAMVFSEGGNNA
jgi:hypothetical protein